MRCPKCGSANADGAKFCNECGSNISVISRDSADERQSAGAGRAGGAEKGERSFGDANTLPPQQARHAAGQAAQEAGVSLDSRYEVLGEIGSGGFAVVLKAHDRKLGRTVAIKRLRAEHLNGRYGQQVVERFRREAQSIAKLNHLNIVTVFDHDCDRDGYYIVMEYVEGGSLRDYLAAHKANGKKVPVATAIRLVRGVAQGLAYAHRMNLIHRDIKPGNILLSRSAAAGGEAGDDAHLVPKLVDFGLARAGAESDVSLSGFGMGTPFYAAPEQRRDAKNVNHTADIYSLGKTLYELVTGEIPDAVDPEAIPPPPELSKIIIKCIKPNPGDRYFSADELIAALSLMEGKKEASGPGAAAKAGGAAGDACPACGMVNAKDLRFCQGCGSGLIRPCPECGRELHVQTPYCGVCGTDVAGFLHLQDIADRIGRYLAEKKYSRVLKEHEQLAGIGFVPRGPKAAELVAAAQAAQADATEEEAKKKSLLGGIDEAWRQEDYDRIEQLLRQYKEVNGALEDDLNRLRDRLPVARQVQVLKRHVEALVEAVEARDWARAQTLFDQRPPVPETVEPEDEKKITACLERISALYAGMSAALASDHSQELKRLHAAIRAARDTASWATAWEYAHNMPALPAQLLAEHRENLLPLRAAIEAESAAIAQSWLQNLTDRAVACAQQNRWGEAQQVQEAIEALPLLPSLRAKWGQSLAAQLREIKIAQLRREMLEALKAHKWGDAETAALALDKLSPGDDEAKQVVAEGAEGKRREQSVAEILRLFQKGLFQKCTVMCDALIQNVGPDFELSEGGFAGSLADYRQLASDRAMEQAARVATLHSLLLAKDWDRAISQAAGLVKDFDWMADAREGLAKAHAGRRLAAAKRGAWIAAASFTVFVAAWGVFKVAGLMRVRSGFNAAVKADDGAKAVALARTLEPRYAPAREYLLCLPVWSNAVERCRAARSQRVDELASALWTKAGEEETAAVEAIKKGKFREAEKGFAESVRLYEEAVAYAADFTREKVVLDKVLGEYRGTLSGQSVAELDKYGGPAWIESKDLALKGQLPQTEPAKVRECAAAMVAASEKLHAAMLQVVLEKKRIGDEAERMKEERREEWEKAGRIYQEALAKQDRQKLEAFAGESWSQAKRLADQGEVATDAVAGREAYKEALAKLLQAADEADKGWRQNRDKVLREYAAVKAECEALLKQAVASTPPAPPSRAGYLAAVACDGLLRKAEEPRIEACIPEEERKAIKAIRSEVDLKLGALYRGPDPKQARWEIPESGLSFVWVEALGAWVGETEVSFKAYRRFFPEHAGGTYEKMPLDGDDQPVVKVSHRDAVLFCDLLTAAERKARRLQDERPDDPVYRLLTGGEWSLCVACGTGRVYPWGEAYPPAYGNYADADTCVLFGDKGATSYSDKWRVSAPVGRSGTNAWGLAEMGGNVKEWVREADGAGAVRDACWRTVSSNGMACAFSAPQASEDQKALDIGFRVILARPPVK